MPKRQATEPAEPVKYERDDDGTLFHPVCRWCHAPHFPGVDYCGKCGRKMAQDRKRGKRAYQDAFAAMQRPFGMRLSDWWTDDVRVDSETRDDVVSYTFDRESGE